MIYQRRSFTDGVGWVSAELDPVARTVTELDESGSVTDTRPFTADENAAADAMQATLKRASAELDLVAGMRREVQFMREAVGPGDAVPGTDSLNAIINTANATINAAPAVHIKALARAVRALTRATIRLGRLAARDFDTPAD